MKSTSLTKEPQGSSIGDNEADNVNFVKTVSEKGDLKKSARNKTGDSSGTNNSTPLEATATSSGCANVTTCFITPFLDRYIQTLSPRWQNYVVRFIFCFLMNILVFGITYIGSFGLAFMIFCFQFKCCNEMLRMDPEMHIDNNSRQTFTLSCVFFVSINYYCTGETMMEFVRALFVQNSLVSFLMKYHLLISLGLYFLAILYFLRNLDDRHLRKQFSQLGWIHCLMLYLTFPAQFQINLTFHGIIWTFLPVMQIVTNDIFAYLCGFFFGHTPLTRLSPKKTWEGFLGAVIPTFVMSFLLTNFLASYDHFVCPLEYRDGWLTHHGCVRNAIFEPQVYTIYGWQLTSYPRFMPHCLVLALFACVGSPVLGGLFASSMKRAFKKKDFDNFIPGHGGFLDRLDCQIAMSFFTWAYYRVVVHVQTSSQLVQYVDVLPEPEQRQLLLLLNEKLSHPSI